jgi:hypothetical protein
MPFLGNFDPMDGAHPIPGNAVNGGWTKIIPAMRRLPHIGGVNRPLKPGIPR